MGRLLVPSLPSHQGCLSRVRAELLPGALVGLAAPRCWGPACSRCPPRTPAVGAAPSSPTALTHYCPKHELAVERCRVGFA